MPFYYWQDLIKLNQTMTKQKILKYILIFLTLIFSFLAWFSIDRAINIPQSSNWIMPGIWFSLLFIFISLDIILIKETHILEIIFFCCFLLTFIFFFNFWNLAFIFLALIFLYLSTVKMRKEMKLNIKISLAKIIASGRAFLIFSLAIMISSQYYFEIKNFNLEKMIPKFEIGKSSTYMASKIISIMNPNLNIDSEDLTIDEFIRQIQSKEFQNMSQEESEKLDEVINNQVGENISQEKKEAIRNEAVQKINERRTDLIENSEQAVSEGRKSLSQMVGFELKGNEKASEVFTQIINKRIANRIQNTFSSEKNLPLFPIILAVLLFLSIVSVGSILNLVYVPIISLLFYVLKKTKLISIIKIPTEQEIIE